MTYSCALFSRGADTLEEAQEAKLELVCRKLELQPGERVLDVGCGCGATTLSAARLVAPGGEVVGVDLSEPMLAVANRRASDPPAANVHFVHADAQVHRFGVGAFDVAISRFGTMFFADQAVAFANIAGALRPGGRLCIATWQPLIANDWLRIPGTALLPFGSMPDAVVGPGMFAQSDPTIVAATLTGAGFHDVDIAARNGPLTLGADPEEAADHLAETGPGRAVLETVPESDRPRAIEAVRAVLADHFTPAGVQLDGAILLTTARRVG
jgi:SAM-dependent methyltransferase